MFALYGTHDRSTVRPAPGPRRRGTGAYQWTPALSSADSVYIRPHGSVLCFARSPVFSSGPCVRTRLAVCVCVCTAGQVSRQLRNQCACASRRCVVYCALLGGNSSAPTPRKRVRSRLKSYIYMYIFLNIYIRMCMCA